MKSTSPGTIVGDNGLQINVKYGSIMYTKKNRRVKIDTVDMNNVLNIGLSLVERWLPPNQTDLLERESILEIEADIISGMRILDIPILIV